MSAETRNYLATLAPIIRAQQDGFVADQLPQRPQDWREAPLFTAPAVQTADVGVTSPQSSDRGVPNSMFVPPNETEMP